MRTQDLLWLSFTDLREKKTRTALTVIMVMIGVASIVALVSLTSGISASIQNSLSSLGPTSIILTSTKQAGFTLADISGIGSLGNVSSVIPVVEGSATLVTSGGNQSVSIIGISQQDLSGLLNGISMYEGSTFNNTITPESLIGYDVAFPQTGGGGQQLSTGQPATLKIGSGRSTQSVSIPIVGILQSYSVSMIPINTGVLMSEQAADTLLHRQSFNMIVVKASNVSDVGALTTTLTDIYGNNARVLSTQQLAQTADQIVGGISMLLVIIAGISLLVAAIGIMNIMLMSVMERTHEIGVLKSLGFTGNSVMAIFLLQALIIGAVGGIVGIGAGVAGSYSLASLASHAQSSNSSAASQTSGGAGFQGRGGGAYAGGGEAGGTFAVQGGRTASAAGSGSASLSFAPVLTPQTVAEALFIAMFVSAIAGMYPAWRASRMEPIDALREL